VLPQQHAQAAEPRRRAVLAVISVRVTWRSHGGRPDSGSM
jgi:hypothetical protein